MEPLSYEGFKALALRSQRAFHLEQRDAYNVAAEDEPFGHLAEDIKLPEEDYWLLDDDTLILSVFSPDGRTGSFAREPGPDLLRQCLAVRDQVWDRAIPYVQYVA